MQTDKFDLWCVVELFGHSQIAGKCTEQNIAGTNMLRVDVPETDSHPPFTKLYGASAIYAINPVDEQTARTKAAQLNVAPIQVYNLKSYLDKQQAALTALPTHADKIADVEFENDPIMDIDTEDDDDPMRF